MTNKARTLYTGMTNDLMRRVHELKNKLVSGSTSKYNIQYLHTRLSPALSRDPGACSSVLRDLGRAAQVPVATIAPSPRPDVFSGE